MPRLDAVSADDLRTALGSVEGKRPAMRLMAAIAIEDGVAQTTVADWLGVERKTVHNWLRRFEDQPRDLAAAAQDQPKPGRPPKLTDAQRAKLATALRNPPTAAGLDATEWSPEKLRRYLATAFEVEYSTQSCRRLLSKLRHQ